uniref:mRNA-decapping enzyme C-terminal domain-containing protein n=2 Tax=Trichobilharzia regenti TaxID=157069 RepID=A0AA85JRW3_TRIRE|nr:unnamed protein product [Trichobilharzia regenti]
MSVEDNLNVLVIQTYDKYCTQILDKSSSAHVYSFQSDKNTWAKTKTGGVFFLYKRSKVPFFAFMILNRKSPTANQMELVTSSLQLQLHTPFLLYKTVTGKIYSIWFYSAKDCERIAEKLGKLVFDAGGLGLRVAQPDRSKSKTQSNSSNPVADSVVNTRESPETVTKGLNQLMDFVRASNESNKTNPLQPSKLHDNNNSNVHNHSEGPSIFDMLHKAEADFNSGASGNRTASQTELTVDDELQRFRTACNLPVTNGNNSCNEYSKPVANGVSSNKKNKPGTGSSHPVNHISVVELEEKLLQEHISAPKSVNQLISLSKLSNELKAATLTDDSSTDDQGLSHASASESPAHRHQARRDGHLDRNRRLLSDDAGYIDDMESESNQDRNLPKSYGVGLRKQRRHLRHQQDNLSDEMISPSNSRLTSRNKSTDNKSICDTIIGEEILVTPDMLTNHPSSILSAFDRELKRDKHALGSSGSFQENKTPTISTERALSSECLTKDQLKETLIHLLQTDDDFVHRIHTGYVSVLERRLSRN